MERRCTFIFGVSILFLSILLNFLTYRVTFLSKYLFYIIAIEPLFSLTFLALYGSNGKAVIKGLASVKWIVLLISVAFVWAYIVLVLKLG